MTAPRPNRWHIGTMLDDPRPWLFEDTGQHTCGAGDEHGHEPYCGVEPVAPVEELVDTASAVWLRHRDEERLEELSRRADAYLSGDPNALNPHLAEFPL